MNKKKNGKGTVTEADDHNEVKATKLMEFIEASDAKKAKKGITIRFMNDLGQGTVYWLEGMVEERLKKHKKALKLKFAENFFRIGSLKVHVGMIQNPYLQRYAVTSLRM